MTKLNYNGRPVSKLWLMVDPFGYKYGSVGIFLGDRSVKFHALNTSSLESFKTLFLEAKATQYEYYKENPLEIKYENPPVRKNANNPSVVYFNWKDHPYESYYTHFTKEFYPILHNIILGLIDDLIKSFNPKPQAITLIDLGCADAAFLRLVGNKRQGVTINSVGIDISSTNIIKARELNSTEFKATYIIADVSSTDLVQQVEEKFPDENPVIVTAQGLMTYRVLDSLESAFVLQSLYRLRNCRVIYLGGVESRSFSDFIPKQIGFHLKTVPVLMRDKLHNPVTILTRVDEKNLISKKIKYLKHHNELDLSLSHSPHSFLTTDEIVKEILAQPSPTIVDISYCRLSTSLNQAMIDLAQKKPIRWKYHHTLISAIDEFISFFVNNPAINAIETHHKQAPANMIIHSRILKFLHNTGQEQIQQLFNFLRHFEKNGFSISDDPRLMQYFEVQFKQLSETLLTHADFSYNLIQLHEPAGNWQRFFALFDHYINKMPSKALITAEKTDFRKSLLSIDEINSNHMKDLGASNLGHCGGHWVIFDEKHYYCKIDPSPCCRKLSEKLFDDQNYSGQSYGYNYSNKDKTEDLKNIKSKPYGFHESRDQKQGESFSSRACLEFLSYQLLNLYLPGSVPHVKLGFDSIKNVYSILSEKVEAVKLSDAEQEYKHLLNLLVIIFVCAYIMGDDDITVENFAWGRQLLKIDPEIASRNFRFTPEAIDPAWLLCHVSVRINNQKKPTSQFHVTLLKFYNRVIGDFLDCLITLKNNILNDIFRAQRTLIISSLQSRIGEENMNFILEFLNDRERQFLEFLQSIKMKDYVFGDRFSEKLTELCHFNDHKDFQVKINVRKKKKAPSIFSNLPFDENTMKIPGPIICTNPSLTIFSGGLRKSKLVRSVSNPILQNSHKL